MLQNNEPSEASMEQDVSPRPDGMIKSPGETGAETASASSSALPVDAERIAGEIKRFSHLSSDLMECLSGLSRNLQSSLEQLNEIQSEINLKKEELKRLYDIEVSATALHQLREDHRLRKESFEILMESQRNSWEEEKARRAQEDKEFLENLKIQRQREEEEYRQKLAIEQQDARQKVDEEMRALQQENRLKLGALEVDYRHRESILKEKESEWTQLIQELEEFMSRLANHARSRAVAHSNSPGLQQKAP
jgi:hypothetical protein